MGRQVKKRVSVQVWVHPTLRADFKQAVRQEERTVAQALRHHMAETVQRAKRREVA